MLDPTYCVGTFSVRAPSAVPTWPRHTTGRGLAGGRPRQRDGEVLLARGANARRRELVLGRAQLLRRVLLRAYFEGYRRIPDGDDPDFIAIEKAGIESLKRAKLP